MTDYIKLTDFATKDALPAGSALKKVKGTEIDDELNAISDAIETKANIESPTLETPSLTSPTITGTASVTGSISLGSSATATTPDTSDDDTSVATTEFVNNKIDTLTFVPAGAVLPYAGTSAPTGYLFCFGQNVSRTTYADLFAALGTTYGSGNGSTTFTLPDLRGRVAAGKDNMGGTSANRLTGGSAAGLNGDTLGGTGGAQEVALSSDQLASHNHSVAYNGTFQAAFDEDTGTFVLRSGSSTTGNRGSGDAHSNVQPTLILNYIIKT